jgi:hypothetical protein
METDPVSKTLRFKYWTMDEVQKLNNPKKSIVVVTCFRKHNFTVELDIHNRNSNTFVTLPRDAWKCINIKILNYVHT